MATKKKKFDPKAILHEWGEAALDQFRELTSELIERRKKLTDRLGEMSENGRLGLSVFPIGDAIRLYDGLIERAKCQGAAFGANSDLFGESHARRVSAIAALSLGTRELRMEEIRSLIDNADEAISDDGIVLSLALMKADFDGRKALAAKRQRVERLTRRQNQVTEAKAENIKAEVAKQYAECGNLKKARAIAAKKYGVGESKVRKLTPSGGGRGRPKKK
ncbi:MAG: hypothetical protein QM661_09665 [Solimonas sp.]